MDWNELEMRISGDEKGSHTYRSEDILTGADRKIKMSKAYDNK